MMRYVAITAVVSWNAYVHWSNGLLVVCTLVQWFVKGCTDLLGGVGTYWNSAIEELVQKCLAVDHPR